MRGPTLACLIVGLSGLLFKAGLSHSFNDDYSMLKWNPLWLSYPKYSSPITEGGPEPASRGYLYKRLPEDRPSFKWSPYYLPSQNHRRLPYYLNKRSAVPFLPDSSPPWEQSMAFEAGAGHAGSREFYPGGLKPDW